MNQKTLPLTSFALFPYPESSNTFSSSILSNVKCIARSDRCPVIAMDCSGRGTTILVVAAVARCSCIDSVGTRKNS